MNKETIKQNVSFDVEIPIDWIDFISNYTDIFGPTYCGYWAKGIYNENDIGWLLRDEEELFDDSNDSLAEKLFIDNQELPKHYYRLDKDTAIKAYAEGIKRWGVNWYEQADAISYDVVIQMALFNDVKYG